MPFPVLASALNTMMTDSMRKTGAMPGVSRNVSIRGAANDSAMAIRVLNAKVIRVAFLMTPGMRVLSEARYLAM